MPTAKDSPSTIPDNAVRFQWVERANPGGTSFEADNLHALEGDSGEIGIDVSISFEFLHGAEFNFC